MIGRVLRIASTNILVIYNILIFKSNIGQCICMLRYFKCDCWANTCLQFTCQFILIDVFTTFLKFTIGFRSRGYEGQSIKLMLLPPRYFSKTLFTALVILFWLMFLLHSSNSRWNLNLETTKASLLLWCCCLRSVYRKLYSVALLLLKTWCNG